MIIPEGIIRGNTVNQKVKSLYKMVSKKKIVVERTRSDFWGSTRFPMHENSDWQNQMVVQAFSTFIYCVFLQFESQRQFFSKFCLHFRLHPTYSDFYNIWKKILPITWKLWNKTERLGIKKIDSNPHNLLRKLKTLI